ncbi:epoxide hydrolase family protein [Aspergillus glaucus CBS 516.65]|uniref:Epoxide hydrolase N-terminal domain-containing protein n=1 Tax=Aspergillus glaucus CBS 516.65 TaxID=1160497 RepID=A0A1L9V733_ASPGL|nr:hypothetical protein ASPGLDRAFT_39588 [Aspergillus glaucus CBS 516.65]OJJ79730.1 hypothetical protein ASPGLDRAFT_39588 [Aspergillus glaucus CBS 516.65]
MSSSFSRLPSTAKVTPAPFKVSFSDNELEDLKTLVRLSRTAPRTYENSQPDRRYGITSDWLNGLKKQWTKDFDWKATEARINEFPQFTTTIEGMTIHFAALFSEREDAVPLLLLHGWPGSFQEFLPLLKLFREEFTPANLPYHLIVPSLPGYTLSSGPPVDKNFDTKDIARVVDQLMKDLGFEGGYVAQGGDIGSRIGRVLGVDYDSCKAVHLNACFMQRPEGFSDETLNEFEQRGLKRAGDFMTTGTAYAYEHGTRTSTIGHVLSSNPIALLAWVGEKYLDWVDDPLPSNTILEFASLYWLTETFPRAIYPYRENFPPKGTPAGNDPRWYISKPFGFSYFPNEVLPVPRSWVETSGNLVFWREHQKGGHFAALERPEQIKADLVDFVKQIWK